MARKKRVDSAAGYIQTVQDAIAQPIKPPAYLKLRKIDIPFWDAMMKTRAKARWTPSDMELAGSLAKLKANLVKLEKELEGEDEVLIKASGDLYPNPKVKLVDMMQGRAIQMSRALHIHAEATQGRSEDQVKVNQAGSDAAAKIKEADEALIPRAH